MGDDELRTRQGRLNLLGTDIADCHLVCKSRKHRADLGNSRAQYVDGKVWPANATKISHCLENLADTPEVPLAVKGDQIFENGNTVVGRADARTAGGCVWHGS